MLPGKNGKKIHGIIAARRTRRSAASRKASFISPFSYRTCASPGQIDIRRIQAEKISMTETNAIMMSSSAEVSA